MVDEDDDLEVWALASSASVFEKDGQMSSPAECEDAVVPSAPRVTAVTMVPVRLEQRTRSSAAVFAAMVMKKFPVAPSGQPVAAVMLIVVATEEMLAARVVGLPDAYSRLVGMVTLASCYLP